MKQSVGMIETIGLTSAWAAADMMIKFAYVDVIKVERSGSGYVTVVVQGDVESVRIALEVGADAAGSKGELIAVHLLSKPDAGLDKLLRNE